MLRRLKYWTSLDACGHQLLLKTCVSGSLIQVLRLSLVVYPVHWIDPLISFYRLSVCQSVCVSVNRSVVERLRPQFFTDFHEIVQAAQKCGRIDAYCLWDNPEVVCRFDFRGVRIPISAVFRLWWTHFSTDQHQIPCRPTHKIRQCRLCIQWWMKPEIEIGL